MAFIRDLVHNLVKGYGIAPQTLTGSSLTPAALDMENGDDLCTVIVMAGPLGATTAFTVTVEESSDNVTFTAVTLDYGDSLAFINTDDNAIRMAAFQRSKRYVRTPLTATGGGPYSAAITVLLAEQLKFLAPNQQ